jgi:hypothetical protein
VALAIKQVDRVSKREGFSFMAMLVRAFFLVIFSSSSLEEASLT